MLENVDKNKIRAIKRNVYMEMSKCNISTEASSREVDKCSGKLS
jgi:hypothetical protein